MERPALSVYMNHAYPPDLQLREIPGTSGVHVMAAGLEEVLPDLLTRAGVGKRPTAAQ